MFKLFILADIITVSPESQLRLIDTGIRITANGERKFKAEAENRGLAYKPFMLEETIKAIRSGFNESYNVLTEIVSELGNIDPTLVTTVEAVYPTSRTSWGRGVWSEPLADEDGDFTGDREGCTVRYRTQRYSNGYSQYEIEAPTASNVRQSNGVVIVGDEHRADNMIMVEVLTNDLDVSESVYFTITEEVVR